MNKVPVDVLGATGVVGQRLLRRLANHPWFTVGGLMASERSAGKRLREACAWRLPGEPYAGFAEHQLLPCTPEHSTARLVLSALDTAPAREIEPVLAERGAWVCSNASTFRMAPGVPLLVPEINADHIEILRLAGRRGGIICNPNCTTTVLVLAMKPLADAFGIEALSMTSMQAVSGAGWPGVASLDALGNVVPHIAKEEEKVEEEVPKILGVRRDHELVPAMLTISAQCHRVPVVDGHTEAVQVRLRGAPSVEQVRSALADFRSPIESLRLPSAPQCLLRLHDAPDRPQPRLDVETDAGMSVHIGRLRPCPLLGIKLVLLGHNAERGAAGGTLLNAELLVARGWLP